LKAITELFIAGTELVEAEARDLRHWTIRVGVSLTLIVAAGILAAAGVLVIAAGLLLALGYVLGTPGAMVIVGVLLLLCAGGFAWKARKLVP